MNYIDQTFNKLRRINISELLRIHSPVINPVTFYPMYNRYFEDRLKEYGWTVDEANKAIEEYYS